MAPARNSTRQPERFRRDLIVIGGSAGALEPLTLILGGLPQTLPACIVVTFHIGTEGRSVLPEVLSAAGELPVRFAEGGEKIDSGRVYIAPPDRHLLVSDGHLEVVCGPRENGFRPAIDALFRSAAQSRGSRVIGIILSGALSDGVSGLARIQHHGGLTIAQHPEEAQVPTMPMGAIRVGAAHRILPASEIAGALLHALEEEPMPQQNTPRAYEGNGKAGRQKTASEPPAGEGLYPTPVFSCPTCKGPLVESREGEEVLSFTCRTGHRFSPESLADSQDTEIENALWTALRALQESAELHQRMAGRAQDGGLHALAGAYTKRAGEAARQAQLLRKVLVGDVQEEQSANTGRRRPAPARRRKS